MRKFEVVAGLSDEIAKNVIIPHRSTKLSAGYDFHAREEVTIPVYGTPAWDEYLKTKGFPTVHTGIKVRMNDDEFMACYNRSSNPSKRGLTLANGVGVIDADYYYANGEVMFQFFNFGKEPYTINVGEAIGQGVFTPYGTVDDEEVITAKRKGGYGSTDKQ